MANVREMLDELRAARNRAKKELTQIEQAIRAIGRLSVGIPTRPDLRGRKQRRKMSAVARKKIAAAQRARWARARKQKEAS